MKVGALDLLCVLPEDEVEPFGIPYLRSILEVGATKSQLEKWEKFWIYFKQQWLSNGMLTRWNISKMRLNDEALVQYYDIVNRTNKGARMVQPAIQ
jgi:hypothetical protein